MTYVLHHLPGTRSLRVLWLMEEMGLDYIVDTKTLRSLKSAEYLAINPLGTVPALQLPGQLLLESGAIMQYLLAKHGPTSLQPDPDDPAFATYLQWFHFAEASFAPWLVTHRFNTKFKSPANRIEAVVVEARDRIEKLLAYLDPALHGRRFIAGECFTAADIMIGHGLYICELDGLLDNASPVLLDYLSSIKMRPAFGRAAST